MTNNDSNKHLLQLTCIISEIQVNKYLRVMFAQRRSDGGSRNQQRRPSFPTTVGTCQLQRSLPLSVPEQGQSAPSTTRCASPKLASCFLRDHSGRSPEEIKYNIYTNSSRQ